MSMLSAEAVEAFLKENPGFLVDHPEILAEIDLMHNSGDAVSLIERQVSILRDQVHHYRNKLGELVRIAEENDHLADRFRTLSLKFMDAPGPEETLRLLEVSLQDDFNAARASLMTSCPELMGLTPSFADGLLRINSDDPKGLPDLPGTISDGVPLCGRFSQALIEALFGDMKIGSVALVPVCLASGNMTALLAIGSEDDGYFHADQGTIFLEYLGALLARRLPVS